MTMVSEKAKALQGRTRKSSGIELGNTAVEEPFRSTSSTRTIGDGRP